MWSDFGGKIDSEVWKASIMHSMSVSVVLGLTSPSHARTHWVCACMHYVLDSLLEQSMYGWCFNINVTEPTTTFCHAWYVRTSLFLGCSNTLYRLFLSWLMWLKYIHLSFLLAQIRMCLHTQVCVHTKCQLLFLDTACPITHITHECHFSIQQEHPFHTWMHAGIHYVGS